MQGISRRFHRLVALAAALPPNSLPAWPATRRTARFTAAPEGLGAPLVRVEVHIGPGLPAFLIVGLPEAVVRESKERVRSALLTAGFDLPAGRITVNLSPADLPKEGGRFDLPIAIGILAASGQLPARRPAADASSMGNWRLSGELRETRKLLPALIAGAAAGHELILPAANALEAGLVGGRASEAGRRSAPRSGGRLSAARALSAGHRRRRRRRRPPRPIWPRCAASTARNARWKSRRPANMVC